MRHLFLINPAAGKTNKTDQYKQEIHQAMSRKQLPYEIRVSEKAGDLTVFAREAAQSGEEYRIYACGGDGTLNEVVNGVVGYDNAAITHYPGGSGNDFIRMFSDPSLFRNLDLLIDGPEAEFDVIRCNDRYGLDICSIGLDARIGTSVSKYKRIPLVTGSGAYLISVVANLIQGVTEEYTIEVNGKTMTGPYTMLCVCNGRWYGGGFNPMPEAKPDDGILNLLLVNPVTRLKVAQVIGPYKAGKFRNYPELFHYEETTAVTVRAKQDMIVNLDGELMYSDCAQFSIVPKGVRFFYPHSVTY